MPDRKNFKKHLTSEEFRHSYLEEKVKLDIEYRLEELKRDFQRHKSLEELNEKVDAIERFVMSVKQDRGEDLPKVWKTLLHFLTSCAPRLEANFLGQNSRFKLKITGIFSTSIRKAKQLPWSDQVPENKERAEDWSAVLLNVSLKHFSIPHQKGTQFLLS